MCELCGERSRRLELSLENKTTPALLFFTPLCGGKCRLMVPMYIYSVSLAVCFCFKRKKVTWLLFKSVLQAVFLSVFAYSMCGMGYFKEVQILCSLSRHMFSVGLSSLPLCHSSLSEECVSILMRNVPLRYKLIVNARSTKTVKGNGFSKQEKSKKIIYLKVYDLQAFHFSLCGGCFFFL